MSQCRPGKTHRWTVVSSKKGYVNCYWCPASKPGTTPGGCAVVLIIGALVGGVLGLSKPVSVVHSLSSGVTNAAKAIIQ